MSNCCSKTSASRDKYSYRYNPTLQTPRIVIALKDYEGQGPDQLTFFEGDRFQVLEDNCALWRVIHMATREIGFVPPDLVQEEDYNS